MGCGKDSSGDQYAREGLMIVIKYRDKLTGYDLGTATIKRATLAKHSSLGNVIWEAIPVVLI